MKLDPSLFIVKPVELELRTSDGKTIKTEFELLDISYIPDFFELTRAFGKDDNKAAEISGNLIKKWIKYNNPELTDKELDNICWNNLKILQNKLLEYHLPKIKESLMELKKTNETK